MAFAKRSSVDHSFQSTAGVSTQYQQPYSNSALGFSYQEKPRIQPLREVEPQMVTDRMTNATELRTPGTSLHGTSYQVTPKAPVNKSQLL